MLTAVAVLVATALEAVFGEPPERVHPVAWLGRAIGPFDREWSRPRLVGLAVAIAVPLVVGSLVAGLVWQSGRLDLRAGVATAGAALFVATSLRMLLAEARGVVGHTDADLARAREEVPSLVGRDPATLTAGQVRSAAVESAAENLADGLVGPLGAFVVAATLARPFGIAAALTAGAGAAAWVKAVNTLDSMLGYRSKPVGWAPARLDDLVMWVPARASALLLAVAGGSPRALREARAWQDRVASPNAGWPMGAIAAAAGVRLEKPGAYVLGDDEALPSVDDAAEAVGIVRAAGVLAYALTVVALAAGEVQPWV